jgi:hypothetical protein
MLSALARVEGHGRARARKPHEFRAEVYGSRTHPRPRKRPCNDFEVRGVQKTAVTRGIPTAQKSPHPGDAPIAAYQVLPPLWLQLWLQLWLHGRRRRLRPLAAPLERPYQYVGTRPLGGWVPPDRQSDCLPIERPGTSGHVLGRQDTNAGAYLGRTFVQAGMVRLK